MNKLLIPCLLLLSTNLIAQLPLDIATAADGLIEVNNLETLNAMRYQLDGSGLRMTADAEQAKVS